MIRGVKAMGLETCVTLGMLEEHQAKALSEAGLDYYNHNLDTSPEFYGQIISTRTYEDRLETLDRVRDAGINVCCGGIIGMGESRRERAGLIALSKVRRSRGWSRSIRSNSFARLRWPASPCRARWCAYRLAASR